VEEPADDDEAEVPVIDSVDPAAVVKEALPAHCLNSPDIAQPGLERLEYSYAPTVGEVWLLYRQLKSSDVVSEPEPAPIK